MLQKGFRGGCINTFTGHVIYYHPQFYRIPRDIAYIIDGINLMDGQAPLNLEDVQPQAEQDLVDQVVAFNLKN